MVTAYVPDRGDIVWIDFEPHFGREQAGHRPALVLSPKSYNQKSELMLACPITSKIKNYPFVVRIKTEKTDGVIVADQIKSLSWKVRKISFHERTPAAIVAETQSVIELLLKG